jgi:hypothetical protein
MGTFIAVSQYPEKAEVAAISAFSAFGGENPEKAEIGLLQGLWEGLTRSARIRWRAWNVSPLRGESFTRERDFRVCNGKSQTALTP